MEDFYIEASFSFFFIFYKVMKWNWNLILEIFLMNLKAIKKIVTNFKEVFQKIFKTYIYIHWAYLWKIYINQLEINFLQ